MKRRHLINVWPAFADLMTVLAVVGLFTTLALSHTTAKDMDLAARVRELEQQLRDAERDRNTRERAWNKERDGLTRQVREAARNEKMFQAIQQAQQLIDGISRRSGLAFGVDQSLQFGDDLVSFELNDVKPIWKADSREQLRRFCAAISGEIVQDSSNNPIKPFFVVEVEGHTDSSQCPNEPNCNWRLSSARAAVLVSLMRQASYCPGGAGLSLRPVGYADTKPQGGDGAPTRRIAVRLVPDYEKIILSLSRGT
jgi:outer membrane protein OmpA-like peptidoglycan-associated protein